MAALHNARWEMFAIGLAQGKNQSQAYRDAGYEESTTNSCTLAKRPEVRARVAELIEQKTSFNANVTRNAEFEHLGALDQAAKDGVCDRTWIITQLMNNVRDASAAGQYAASNGALKMLGQEIGMFIDKPKSKDEDAKVALEPPPVSIDDINRLLEDKGYEGPLIDLTKKPPKAKVRLDPGVPVVIPGLFDR